MSNIDKLNNDFQYAVEYFNHAEELLYQFPKVELISNKGTINYQSFISTLKRTTPQELTYYHKADFEQVTGYALSRMYEIFGKSIPIEEYENLLYMCAISKGPDPFECNYVEVNGQKLLLFDRLDTFDSIPCVAHEAAHHIQDKYLNLFNGHHQEVLSMLIELILADEISTKEIDSNIFNKNIAKTIKALKRLLQYVEETKEYNELAKSSITSKIKVDRIKEHREQMAYTYTVSFIYAYNLFIRYKENPEHFIIELQNIFYNQSSIDSLIGSYNLDFSSSSTFKEPNQLLKSIRK